ncbi:hypothetical protein ACN1CD_13385 [Pedobacter sp. N23S346]
MTFIQGLSAQQPEFSKVKTYIHQLDNVMEIIDTTELKVKLKEVELQFREVPNELNKVRLGIIYHETALNLSFFSKNEYKGYAQKSFDQLSNLFNSSITNQELMPYITSYRASALALVGAETKKLKLLDEAFKLFEDAITKYAAVSYLPEFLRGSVAENLPWFLITKRKLAIQDFQNMINKQENNPEYADWKIMSFTYWAWAKQHQGRKYRTKALAYLEQAIALDPNYKAGRHNAEELKSKFVK